MQLLSRLAVIIFSAKFLLCSHNPDILNLSHLNHLYSEINFQGKTLGLIYIYSGYPDYKPIEAKGEGITCLDDISRAAIVFLEHFKQTGDKESLIKGQNLLNTILYLQSDNGLFYNFLYKDFRINKTHKNSIPGLNWWTARAVWVLGYAYSICYKLNKSEAELYKSAVEKVYSHIDSNLENYGKYGIINGIKYPEWLISGSASDATSEMLPGLIEIYRIDKDENLKNRIAKLVEGIRKMQVTDDRSEFYGAFLSWKNYWHSWGNSQSFALLSAYEILKDEKILNQVRIECDNYYSRLLKDGFLTKWRISMDSQNRCEITEKAEYPQIAYDFRPVVTALCKLGDITGNRSYYRMGVNFYRWFLGSNPPGKIMYNTDNGRCFDGINDRNNINRNSGAESTIEALLSTLEIQKRDFTVEELKRTRK